MWGWDRCKGNATERELGISGNDDANLSARLERGGVGGKGGVGMVGHGSSCRAANVDGSYFISVTVVICFFLSFTTQMQI